MPVLGSALTPPQGSLEDRTDRDSRMVYNTPPENISIYIKGHGQFTTSPASMDAMIEKYLRPKVEDMRREMRDYLTYMEGEEEARRYDDLTSKTQYLMVWAEFCGLATN